MRLFIEFVRLYGSVKLWQSLHCCVVRWFKKNMHSENLRGTDCSLINRNACVCFPSSARRLSALPLPARPGRGWKRGEWRRTGPRSSLPPGLPLQSKRMRDSLQLIQQFILQRLSPSQNVKIKPNFAISSFQKITFGYATMIILAEKDELHNLRVPDTRDSISPRNTVTWFIHVHKLKECFNNFTPEIHLFCGGSIT